MKLKDFNYVLPKELIAQRGAKPRDRSRLLVLDKKSGSIGHKHFFELPGYLKKGDVLVLNDSKVFPARLLGSKSKTGGKIEIFLLKKIKGAFWQCLIGGKGRKENMIVDFGKHLRARVIKNNGDGTWNVDFNLSGKKLMAEIGKIGMMPLPPYIKRKTKQKEDASRYQTIYADDKKTGSVAAPTAGLHFTPRLIKMLKAKGVHIEYVTLHVGLGTFASVKAENIKEHKMHAEWAEVRSPVISRIIKAKQEGRRVIAVGTTSARTLETVFSKKTPIRKGFSGWTDIFIYPGYKFQAVDGLVTNFHLPESTLLMLVSALAGIKKIKKAYQEAIRKRYRFYSYGDAMLII